MYISIGWEISFFHRRWRGFSYILWWLWPVCWYVLEEEWHGEMKMWDYYPDFQSALRARDRRLQICSETRESVVKEIMDMHTDAYDGDDRRAYAKERLTKLIGKLGVDYKLNKAEN